MSPFNFNLSILVLGAGPSGLSIARLLQINGFKNVKIAERDLNRFVRIGGSSLDLHEDTGLKFIKKANLFEQFKKICRPEGESVSIADKNGNVILRKPHLKYYSKKPEIDRGDLRNLLIDSLENDTILWDHQFISLEENETTGKTIVHFKNGNSIEADLVIGADGANSKVRPFVSKDIKVVYSGITLIEFEVENPKTVCPLVYDLVDHGLFYALSDEKGFIVQLKGDGNLIIYLSSKRDENWIKESGLDFKKDFEQIKEFIKNDVLSDWSEIYLNVLDNATQFTPRPLYSIDLNPMVEWKSKSNITLIGDSAHCIVPFAGKGINEGMSDACDLLDCLLEKCKDGDELLSLHNRLNKYESLMHKRMIETGNDSNEAKEIVHSKDACNQLVDRFLGNYKYIKSLIPYLIYTTNYLTDLFGYSNK